jgi:hypothetical protein
MCSACKHPVNDHERLKTGECMFLKIYLLIIETDRITIKYKLIFSSVSSASLYSLICCFYLSLLYNRNIILYKFVICSWRRCERYSKSILIYTSYLFDLLLSLDLQLQSWNKLTVSLSTWCLAIGPRTNYLRGSPIVRVLFYIH